MFSERGFVRASLDNIAAEAGLTKGAIYSSFGSKDRLFFEVLKLRTDERIAASDQAVGEDTAAAGTALGELLQRFTADDPTWHLALIEFWVSMMHDPGSDAAAEFAARRRHLRATIADHLVAAGIAPAKAPRLAMTLLALSNGLAIELAIDPEGIDDAFPAALAALLGRPAAS